MDQPRTLLLLLLRHAEAAETPPGGRDVDRRLTTRGQDQAQAVGKHLQGQGLHTVDHVLCSSAPRARQTLELLDLRLDDATVEMDDRFYNAGTDTLVQALRDLPDTAATVLLVGHAPGVPGVAYELADPEASEPGAAAAIQSRFPVATLALLEWTGPWSQPQRIGLRAVRIGT